MAGTRTVVTTNVTYDFKWTGVIANLDEIADAAAHYLWNVGKGDHGTEEKPMLYSSLSVAQKLAILDTHLAQVLMDAARTYKSNLDQEAARVAAEAYSAIIYKL